MIYILLYANITLLLLIRKKGDGWQSNPTHVSEPVTGLFRDAKVFPSRGVIKGEVHLRRNLHTQGVVFLLRPLHPLHGEGSDGASEIVQ